MDPAPRSGCAINAAVEVLGDPGAILVLRDIIVGNRRYFREILAGSEEGVPSNMLARRLEQLVAAGLLSRDVARRPRRAACSLTEAGIQVLQVMIALVTEARHTATASTVCGPTAASCSAMAASSWWRR